MSVVFVSFQPLDDPCEAKDQVLWTLMAHDVACTSIQDPFIFAHSKQSVWVLVQWVSSPMTTWQGWVF